MTKLTFEKWDKKYRPICSDPEREPGNILFETYGEQLETVRQHENKHIWTVVDGERSRLYIIPGFRWVNRLNYVVTEEPWESEDIEVKW